MVIADTFTNLSCYMSHDVKQGAHIPTFHFFSPTQPPTFFYLSAVTTEICYPGSRSFH